MHLVSKDVFFHEDIFPFEENSHTFDENAHTSNEDFPSPILSFDFELQITSQKPSPEM